MRVVSADDGAGKGDGRVQMRARTPEGLRDEHPAEHGDGPACGDDHPSSIGCVGFAQRDVGIDAVAEQDENQGAQILAEPDRMHRIFLAVHCRRRIARCQHAINGSFCGTQALCMLGVVFAKSVVSRGGLIASGVSSEAAEGRLISAAIALLQH